MSVCIYRMRPRKRFTARLIFIRRFAETHARHPTHSHIHIVLYIYICMYIIAHASLICLKSTTLTHLRLPTGGVAYGTPKYASTGGLARTIIPRNGPYLVFTVCRLYLTLAKDDAEEDDDDDDEGADAEEDEELLLLLAEITGTHAHISTSTITQSVGRLAEWCRSRAPKYWWLRFNSMVSRCCAVSTATVVVPCRQAPPVIVVG